MPHPDFDPKYEEKSLSADDSGAISTDASGETVKKSDNSSVETSSRHLLSDSMPNPASHTETVENKVSTGSTKDEAADPFKDYRIGDTSTAVSWTKEKSLIENLPPATTKEKISKEPIEKAETKKRSGAKSTEKTEEKDIAHSVARKIAEAPLAQVEIIQGPEADDIDAKDAKSEQVTELNAQPRFENLVTEPTEPIKNRLATSLAVGYTKPEDLARNTGEESGSIGVGPVNLADKLGNDQTGIIKTLSEPEARVEVDRITSDALKTKATALTLDDNRSRVALNQVPETTFKTPERGSEGSDTASGSKRILFSDTKISEPKTSGDGTIKEHKTSTVKTAGTIEEIPVRRTITGEGAVNLNNVITRMDETESQVDRQTKKIITGEAQTEKGSLNNITEIFQAEPAVDHTIDNKLMTRKLAAEDISGKKSTLGASDDQGLARKIPFEPAPSSDKIKTVKGTGVDNVGIINQQIAQEITGVDLSVNRDRITKVAGSKGSGKQFGEGFAQAGSVEEIQEPIRPTKEVRTLKQDDTAFDTTRGPVNLASGTDIFDARGGGQKDLTAGMVTEADIVKSKKLAAGSARITRDLDRSEGKNIGQIANLDFRRTPGADGSIRTMEFRPKVLTGEESGGLKGRIKTADLKIPPSYRAGIDGTISAEKVPSFAKTLEGKLDSKIGRGDPKLKAEIASSSGGGRNQITFEKPDVQQAIASGRFERGDNIAENIEIASKLNRSDNISSEFNPKIHPARIDRGGRAEQFAELMNNRSEGFTQATDTMNRASKADLAALKQLKIDGLGDTPSGSMAKAELASPWGRADAGSLGNNIDIRDRSFNAIRDGSRQIAQADIPNTRSGGESFQGKLGGFGPDVGKKIVSPGIAGKDFGKSLARSSTAENIGISKIGPIKAGPDSLIPGGSKPSDVLTNSMRAGQLDTSGIRNNIVKPVRSNVAESLGIQASSDATKSFKGTLSDSSIGSGSRTSKGRVQSDNLTGSTVTTQDGKQYKTPLTFDRSGKLVTGANRGDSNIQNPSLNTRVDSLKPNLTASDTGSKTPAAPNRSIDSPATRIADASRVTDSGSAKTVNTTLDATGRPTATPTRVADAINISVAKPANLVADATGAKTVNTTLDATGRSTTTPTRVADAININVVKPAALVADATGAKISNTIADTTGTKVANTTIDATGKAQSTPIRAAEASVNAAKATVRTQPGDAGSTPNKVAEISTGKQGTTVKAFDGVAKALNPTTRAIETNITNVAVKAGKGIVITPPSIDIGTRTLGTTSIAQFDADPRALGPNARVADTGIRANSTNSITFSDGARSPFNIANTVKLGDGKLAPLRIEGRVSTGNNTRYITGLELTMIISLAGIARVRGNGAARLDGKLWSVERRGSKLLINVDGKRFEIKRGFGKGKGKVFLVKMEESKIKKAKMSTKTMPLGKSARRFDARTQARELAMRSLLNKYGLLNPSSRFGKNSIGNGRLLQTRFEIPKNPTSASELGKLGKFNLNDLNQNQNADQTRLSIVSNKPYSETRGFNGLSFFESLINMNLTDNKQITGKPGESIDFEKWSSARYDLEDMELLAQLDSEEILEDEDTQNGKALAPTLRRQIYYLTEGDTLSGIARNLYNDADIGWLIADLNKHVIKETYMDGKRICEISNRQAIELPVFHDVEEFYQNRKSDHVASRLVTIVTSRQIDQEVIDNALGPVLGYSQKAPHPKKDQVVPPAVSKQQTSFFNFIEGKTDINSLFKSLGHHKQEL